MIYALAAFVILLALFFLRGLTHPHGFQAWFLYGVARIYSRGLFGWKATNKCNVPEDTAAILYANHTSPADPMLLWYGHHRGFKKGAYAFRIIGFLMAREYYETPGLVGWISRVMQSIPVERGGRDMGPARAALQRLKDDKLVAVFPEGRINDSAPDERLLPGDTGAAWLALKSKVPIIPVYLRNAPRAKSMVACFFTRTHARVTYGDPVDLSKWLGKRLTQDLLLEVTEHLMKQLAKTGGVEVADPPSVNNALAVAPPQTRAAEQQDAIRPTKAS